MKSYILFLVLLVFSGCTGTSPSTTKGATGGLILPLAAGVVAAMSPSGQRGVNSLAQLMILQGEAQDQAQSQKAEAPEAQTQKGLAQLMVLPTQGQRDRDAQIDRLIHKMEVALGKGTPAPWEKLSLTEENALLLAIRTKLLAGQIQADKESYQKALVIINEQVNTMSPTELADASLLSQIVLARIQVLYQAQAGLQTEAQKEQEARLAWRAHNQAQAEAQAKAQIEVQTQQDKINALVLLMMLQNASSTTPSAYHSGTSVQTEMLMLQNAQLINEQLQKPQPNYILPPYNPQPPQQVNPPQTFIPSTAWTSPNPPRNVPPGTFIPSTTWVPPINTRTR